MKRATRAPPLVGTHSGTTQSARPAASSADDNARLKLFARADMALPRGEEVEALECGGEFAFELAPVGLGAAQVVEDLDARDPGVPASKPWAAA